MDLLMLAPEIQDEILFLPAVTSGKDQICERQFREVVAVLAWDTPCWISDWSPGSKAE